jgi:hypothetical protein
VIARKINDMIAAIIGEAGQLRTVIKVAVLAAEVISQRRCVCRHERKGD